MGMENRISNASTTGSNFRVDSGSAKDLMPLPPVKVPLNAGQNHLESGQLKLTTNYELEVGGQPPTQVVLDRQVVENYNQKTINSDGSQTWTNLHGGSLTFKGDNLEANVVVAQQTPTIADTRGQLINNPDIAEKRAREMIEHGSSSELFPKQTSKTSKVGKVAEWAGEIIKPEIWVFGETHGNFGLLSGGNFGLVSTENGSVTYFGTKPLSERFSLPFGILGRLGIVGTIGFKGQEMGPGFAGKFPIGGVDGLVWANVRQNGLTAEALMDGIKGSTKDKPFSVSVNLGVAFSASDAALLGVIAATGGTGAVAKAGLDAAGTDAWLGLGWRAEMVFVDGKLSHFNISGKKISVEDFEKFVLSQRAEAFQVPNLGNSKIASMNQTQLYIHGQSPWDGVPIKRQSDGAPVLTARGDVDVLNHGNSVLSAVEPIIELATENLLLKPGEKIRDNAHAKQLIDELYRFAESNPDLKKQLETRLVPVLTQYDLSFGSIPLKTAQNIYKEQQKLGLAPPIEKPIDYDFVRDVFEGKYRYSGDMNSQYNRRL